MKKTLFILSFAGIIAVGCSPKKEVETSDDTQTIEQTSAEVTESNTVITGVYKGTLPCADCSGIETEIKFNEDGTYEKTTKYLGKGEENVFSDMGDYSLDQTTKIITLDGIDDAPAKFLYNDSEITQLDMDGNPVEGELAEFYILKK